MKAVIGNRYKHYKGKEYIVLYIAHHSETLEELVVYQAQYDSEDFGKRAVWVRPRSLFEDEIKLNGVKVARFTVME